MLLFCLLCPPLEKKLRTPMDVMDSKLPAYSFVGYSTKRRRSKMTRLDQNVSKLNSIESLNFRSIRIDK